MALGYQRAKAYLTKIVEDCGVDILAERLSHKPNSPPRQVPGRNDTSMAAVASRWDLLPDDEVIRADLLDPWTVAHLDSYRRNIEHLIGTVKVPIGLAGPLRVNGLHAQGDFYAPLATTEATLVATYSRGCRLITEAGGASAALISEGVSRAPVVVFHNLPEMGLFLDWVFRHMDKVEAAANASSAFGRLEDLEVSVEGTKVYFQFIFSTGDAAGQNMVTIATRDALAWIVKHSPVKPKMAFLEGNFSGDKKASAQAFQRVRGRKVVAEAVLPSALIERHLHTTTARMVEVARLGMLGGIMSGTIGVQGHCANAITALFIACGQDAACVSEAAVGITDLELAEDGALHACLTMPNLIVGTVGGGTGLPSQRAALAVMGLVGAGNARSFAEVTAALCLAGELSLIGAISAGDFAAAHARLARGRELGSCP